ncbi:MAG TPA: hypothetical protein VNH11_09445 [Pirellulales bacterium]|nr:hypothetical protein [Pirellulales bacterium]
MRWFITSLASVMLFAAWVAAAPAADKLVPEEGATEVMLLLQPAVCDDLKLSKDERDKIHKFASAQWEKAQKVSKLGENERDREFKEMTKDNERFLKDTLTADQRKRFDQILLQVAGLLWVTRPEIASKLNLSADQKKRAKELQQEARHEMEELIHSTSDEKKEQELQELRATSRKRLMSLLSDEQKSKWKEMRGEPLKGEIYFAAGGR